MLTVEQQTNLTAFAKASVICEKAVGCPAEVSLAQAILESNWGQTVPPDSCNVFGIKDTDKLPGCSYTFTQEYVNGTWQTLKLAFEKFPDYASCFIFHAKLITGGATPQERNCYYAHFQLYLSSKSLDGFVWGIAAHYATGPRYAPIVLQLIKQKEVQAALAAARGTVPV